MLGKTWEWSLWLGVRKKSETKKSKDSLDLHQYFIDMFACIGSRNFVSLSFYVLQTLSASIQSERTYILLTFISIGCSKLVQWIYCFFSSSSIFYYYYYWRSIIFGLMHKPLVINCLFGTFTVPIVSLIVFLVQKQIGTFSWIYEFCSPTNKPINFVLLFLVVSFIIFVGSKHDHNWYNRNN